MSVILNEKQKCHPERSLARLSAADAVEGPAVLPQPKPSGQTHRIRGGKYAVKPKNPVNPTNESTSNVPIRSSHFTTL